MPRGGARTNSGPAPDPNSLRSAKLAEKNGKRELPREFPGPAPEWPLNYASARTIELWERYWKKPQAFIWFATNAELEVAIHVQTFTEAEAPSAPTSTRTLLLQQMNSLLLTEASLAKAGYTIAGVDEVGVTKKTAPAAAARPSSRARLRAVPDEPGRDS